MVRRKSWAEDEADKKLNTIKKKQRCNTLLLLLMLVYVCVGGALCVSPFATLQQYVQLTPVGRQDFGIHQGFQCVQYHRLHRAQPGPQGVHLLTDTHVTKPEDTGRSPSGLNDWMSRPTTLLRHLASPCAAVWPPEPWTQRAESESVTMLPAEEPNPGPTSGPDWVPGNPTPAKSLGSRWLLKTMEKKNKNNKETIQVQRWEVTKYKYSVAALK